MNGFAHIEMVGKIIEVDELGRLQIFINSNNSIQYRISNISNIPNVIDSSNSYTGYLDSITDLTYEDDEYASKDERITKFRNYIRDCLFLFTHRVDQAGKYKIADATVIPKPKDIKSDEHFVAIPCFKSASECNEIDGYCLYRSYENYEQFKHSILTGLSLGRIHDYQISEMSDFPMFIIWNGGNQLKALGPISSADRQADGDIYLKIDESTGLYEIDLEESNEDEYLDSLLQGRNESLIHIAESKYFALAQKLTLKNAERIDNPEKYSANNISDIQVEAIRELPTQKDENEIFEYFRYHSQKSRLFYKNSDIANFHTAIKTGNLVILSGMSGTGKSALVDTYAKALGIEKNTLIIPVRPSWNDDSDLLGYVDLVHMVYRPSDTGFIKMLVEASREENAKNIYMICLDEMNLARVEHYFSQFLSILEKSVGTRDLVLYDQQYSGKLFNSSEYPQKITIGDNVKFIGTVNIDESTYHFSDKVLDRANVISLDVVDYSEPQNWKVDKYKVSKTPTWENDEFKKLVKNDYDSDAYMKLRAFLWNVHKLLNENNKNLGVGPRIVKSIELYLSNIPEGIEDYSLTMSDGIDYQFEQRILTKVRGPEEQLKAIFANDGDKTKLESLLDEFSEISDFSRSRKVIEHKEKELKIYGYCI